jgi:bacterioferritin-associated ferredoxin
MELRTIRKYITLQIVTERREPAMYVCLCNALTDRDLHLYTAGGNCSVSMVYRACGCQPQCGKCVPFVRQMLRQGAESATSGKTTPVG